MFWIIKWNQIMKNLNNVPAGSDGRSCFAWSRLHLFILHIAAFLLNAVNGLIAFPCVAEIKGTIWEFSALYGFHIGGFESLLLLTYFSLRRGAETPPNRAADGRRPLHLNADKSWFFRFCWWWRRTQMTLRGRKRSPPRSGKVTCSFQVDPWGPAGCWCESRRADCRPRTNISLRGCLKVLTSLRCLPLQSFCSSFTFLSPFL